MEEKTYKFSGVKNYYSNSGHVLGELPFTSIFKDINIENAILKFEACFDEEVWHLTLEDGTTTTECDWESLKENY